MAAPTISTLDLGDVAERVDNGQRLALVEEALALAPPPERREPLDPETAQRVADCLATARQEFISAMKRLDLDREQDGAADLHVRIALMAIDVDDLLALLAERWAS